MLKIKFKEDMFISNLECIEKDTIMYLKESKDYFSIHSKSGQVIARYDYCLKDDIYNYFESMNDGVYSIV